MPVHCHLPIIQNFHFNRTLFYHYQQYYFHVYVERKRILSLFIRSGGVDKIRFTGGEPTISKQLPLLIKHVHDTGLVKTIGKQTDPMYLLFDFIYIHYSHHTYTHICDKLFYSMSSLPTIY